MFEAYRKKGQQNITFRAIFISINNHWIQGCILPNDTHLLTLKINGFKLPNISVVTF